MDKYKFGEFIYNNRKKQGLTQEDMANKIGIAEATYCRKEKGNA